MTRSLALGVIALAFAGCASADVIGTNESLDWNPGPFVSAARETTGWKGIRGEETWLVIYLKEGETAARWTQMAEVIQLPVAITTTGNVSWNPESVMNYDKAAVQQKQCPTDMWTVLQKDETSILYEWLNIRCPGFLHQQQIVRIVMGRWYLWFVSYGIRDITLSEDERKALIENLLTARVIRN